MAELLSFTIPAGSEKTLFVWELNPGPGPESLKHSLFTVFSQFGLLYSVRVFPNAPGATPGFYAIIKFYSARDACSAQKACDQKQLFQNSPVKVRLCTRRKMHQYPIHPLNSFKCQELANYYLGFNGWSKRIITLQKLSDFKVKENTSPIKSSARQSLKYFCALEVVLPAYSCRSPGAGIAEDYLEQLEGPLEFILKRKKTQKLAIQKALSDAFQKLLMVVLESGKVVVEYRSTEERDSATDEFKDLIQVNDVSRNQAYQGEEECLSDFGLEEE
ncbi:RAD52 motif-containing protein 1 isoform X2 [Monodelphis domestica]|uniref:RAD52 motif-containing protein 1 isoform X2 n=1 Tax=Monodelphis domestica TaxID=13616 RepID=UPI00020F6039|nr:RAD52 motif-containing protein 1 isoform X2 [Monodelphis domestica]